ncbi:phage major tail tube protein [Pseudodesulfovibrio thermohalotolerans]|uniref:phage major tail tube protein n=1 Tax=Pseudodesulfovibrio thermohalotolerans TaxID=2880651 RepID=UPI002442769B|nr:phage major tail tube protein [Pseudodesulfovibrio thermohalotolerans]WFS63458.1 phage major tail tube protein [Pseudodesulfovibrio thermohalotolerans]
MSNIPEKLVAFQCYKDGKVLIGVVDVEFSGGENMSEELTGAGIAGAIESPTIGHVKPISAKIKFRTRTRQSVELMAPVAHVLELRASIQSRTVGGALATSPEKVVIQAIPKGGVGGKFETGKSQDNDRDFSVTYYKAVVNGQEVLEIDPINSKYVVDGVDYLAGVRSDIGMEG